MEKDIVDRLLEFAKENEERIAIMLLLGKIIREMQYKDDEIDKLREEVRCYKKKLKEEVELELASESANPVLKAPIMECGLPLYVAKDLCYSTFGFDTLGEVVRFTKKELLGIRGFGGKRLAILESFLEKHGLALAK